MSAISLFTALALIGSLAVIAVEVVYRRKLSLWREHHEPLFMTVHFLIMLFATNMALITVFDAAGLLWTDVPRSIAIVYVGFALLFGAVFLKRRQDSTSPHSPYIFQVRGAYKNRSREEAIAVLRNVISRSESDEEAKAALTYLQGLEEPVGEFVSETIRETSEKSSGGGESVDWEDDR